MSAPGGARRLLAILSADVVGYSRLMTADESATVALLKERIGQLGGQVRQHGGRVIDAVGDNLLGAFPSAVDGVACALAAQQEIERRNAELPEERRMRFRIGVHVGDVMVEGGMIYGDGVNIAARLEPLAEPGGVCVSEDAWRQVQHRMPLAGEDLGPQALKNIADRVGAIRIRPAEVAGGEQRAEAAARTVPGFGGRPAVAILAFDNLSGDPDDDYLADGIAEDLIARLSAIRLFPVIARNSSFAYKGRATDVRQIGRELAVHYVLEGSVRRESERVRIVAQLIDATSGHHVWAARHDRDLRSLFALQDEITETLAGALEPELVRSEQQLALRAPVGHAAWRALQRGWWHLHRFTREDLAESRRWFREATEREPGLSVAHAGLAAGHVYDVICQWSESPVQSVAEAFAAACNAVGLDESDALAHTVLGMVCAFGGDHARAVAEFECALELNPSSALAHHGMAFALVSTGRADDAVAMAEKAIRLSPRDPLLHEFLYNLALAHFVAGRPMPSHPRAAASRPASTPRAARACWPPRTPSSARPTSRARRWRRCAGSSRSFRSPRWPATSRPSSHAPSPLAWRRRGGWSEAENPPGGVR